ncbi:Uncharacterized protein Fot_19887 [Forsythia ovata]|uniref:Uncharacterized protein n=1 Tax=Forsythia ovata TaxID=205694 RepID=A0ABD1VMB5_9LAMI
MKENSTIHMEQRQVLFQPSSFVSLTPAVQRQVAFLAKAGPFPAVLVCLPNSSCPAPISLSLSPAVHRQVATILSSSSSSYSLPVSFRSPLAARNHSALVISLHSTSREASLSEEKDVEISLNLTICKGQGKGKELDN